MPLLTPQETHENQNSKLRSPSPMRNWCNGYNICTCSLKIVVLFGDRLCFASSFHTSPFRVFWLNQNQSIELRRESVFAVRSDGSHADVLNKHVTHKQSTKYTPVIPHAKQANCETQKIHTLAPRCHLLGSSLPLRMRSCHPGHSEWPRSSFLRLRHH